MVHTYTSGMTSIESLPEKLVSDSDWVISAVPSVSVTPPSLLVADVDRGTLS